MADVVRIVGLRSKLTWMGALCMFTNIEIHKQYPKAKSYPSGLKNDIKIHPWHNVH